MYACFAVSESAALRALLGEPRMLGMTPDTVLVDLNAEETTPALASMLRREATAWWRRSASSLGGGIRPVDANRAALLTVVAHATPLGAVPAAGLSSIHSSFPHVTFSHLRHVHGRKTTY